VGVAAGPFVFIYRNLRPWYKFSLPSKQSHPDEAKAWSDMHSGLMTVADAKLKLSNARDSGVQLSSTSQELLAIDELASSQQFVDEQRDKPLATQTVATCMEVLKKDLDEDDAVSMLVVGCENGQILVLDPAGSSICRKWELPSAPTHMAITGTRDVEFRIVVACRDGSVHTIKENGPSGLVIELESIACGLVRLEKSIIVGCMTNTVHAFSLRGKKMYSIYLPAPIVNMELLELKKTRAAKAMMVAMGTGEVWGIEASNSSACAALTWPATCHRRAKVICRRYASTMTSRSSRRSASTSLSPRAALARMVARRVASQ